jgi:hypothetical protein
MKAKKKISTVKSLEIGIIFAKFRECCWSLGLGIKELPRRLSQHVRASVLEF